jgi:hypothetical protein
LCIAQKGKLQARRHNRRIAARDAAVGHASLLPAGAGIGQSNGLSGSKCRKGGINTDERFVFLSVFQLFFTLVKMNKKIDLRVLSGGVACG